MKLAVCVTLLLPLWIPDIKASTVLEEAEDVGCFTSWYSQTFGQRLEAAISWDRGVHACAHRRVRYTAVQHDPSYPSFNSVFCGDDLEQHSSPVNESRCVPCAEDTSRKCGGVGVVSIYRVNVSRSIRLVLATQIGIKLLENNSLTSVVDLVSPDTIDLFYEEDVIFFSYSDQKYRTHFSPHSSRYVKPIEISKYEAKSSLNVDWMHKKLFWLSYKRRHLGYYREDSFYFVHQSGLRGENEVQTRLPGMSNAPDDSAFDSLHGYLFLLTHNQIRMFDVIKNVELSQLTIVGQHMRIVKKIAVDPALSEILLVGSEDSDADGYPLLASFDYKNTQFRVLYNGQEVSAVSTIDIADRRPVWVNEEEGRYVVYSCQLTPRCQNVTVISILNEEVYDLKIYNPAGQTVDVCSRFNCSHNCTIKEDKVNCTCPGNMTLGSDNHTCRVSDGGLTQGKFPRLLGCYSTSHVDGHLHRADELLTWEESFHLCDSRNSKFLGVSVEPGQPTYNYVYCGNDMLEHSSMLNVSLCHTCHEDRTRQCGGDLAMSLYQIRDEDPLAVLLAMDTGVKIFSEDTAETKDRTESSEHLSALDYDYMKDVIYCIQGGSNIAGSHYSSFAMKYLRPSHNFELPENVNDIAVDWVYNRTFFSSGMELFMTHSQDSNGYKSILRGFLFQELVLNPYRGLIYFLQASQLFVFDMSRNNTTKVDTGPVRYIHKVALDVETTNLYLVISDGSIKLFIVRVKKSRTWKIFSGPELTYVVGFGVLEDLVVWINLSDGLYTLYKCKLSPRCQGKDVVALHHWTERIYDMKIYHPKAQVLKKTGCDVLGCSHDCVLESLFNFKCTCPDTLELSDDNKTCSERLSVDLVTSSNLSSTPAVDEMVTVTDTPDEEGSFTSYLVSTPSQLEKHLTTDHPEKEMASTDTKEGGRVQKDEPGDTASSHTTLVTVVISVASILIVIILIIIYFQIKPYNLFRRLHGARKSESELNELSL